MIPLTKDCYSWIVGKSICCMPDEYLFKIGFYENDVGNLQHDKWSILITPAMRTGAHVVDRINIQGKLHTKDGWYWMPEFSALANAGALIICEDD